MNSPTVPVAPVVPVHADVNGHRETFLVGHVGTAEIGCDSFVILPPAKDGAE